MDKASMLPNSAILMKKSRLRVKGLKVKDKEKIKEAIAISIQKGNYTTREIGLDIGKDHSTISRYLSEMEDDPKWSIKRDVNGGIVISLQQQLANEYAKLQNEKFSQLPSIQKWITYLKSGKVPAVRIRYMTNIIHGISDQLMVKAIILNAANYDTTTGEYDSGEYDEEWGWGYVDAWLSRVYDHVNSITVSEDQHKYRYVTLDEGERFVMTLTWNRHMSSDSVIRGTSNFDLYVYDPSGNPMWPACSTCISEDLNDNVEVVYFTAPVDGKYKIDIYGRTIVPTSPTGSTDRYYAASTHTLSSS